ncbi:MAG: sensor histidine kinase [Deltaproteobacteria bacterium]|nr:sensor histidine kinase [Deltaproteobacteria bacterium]MBW2136528.1 sensor histidine kinase [Deltaproteobacteria bacterium]
MLVIIVVSAFVGLFMARNALSDVEQVTETALDITDGALGQRVKIKYTRPGGSVIVSVREDNDYVTLEIRDTGICGNAKPSAKEIGQVMD